MPVLRLLRCDSGQGERFAVDLVTPFDLGSEFDGCVANDRLAGFVQFCANIRRLKCPDNLGVQAREDRRRQFCE